MAVRAVVVTLPSRAGGLQSVEGFRILWTMTFLSYFPDVGAFGRQSEVEALSSADTVSCGSRKTYWKLRHLVNSFNSAHWFTGSVSL